MSLAGGDRLPHHTLQVRVCVDVACVDVYILLWPDAFCCCKPAMVDFEGWQMVTLLLPDPAGLLRPCFKPAAPQQRWPCSAPAVQVAAAPAAAAATA